jgi:pimeloyl-ACP methyl ester carboxylesterase
MEWVTVAGSQAAYVSGPRRAAAGDGPLVCVHGAGGTHRTWLPLLEGLGARFAVVAVDLPGHGASAGKGSETIAGYADFVRGFLDALGLRRASLCGHSMGGAIVQAVCLAAPARVSGLVLAGTGARLRVSPKILEPLAAGDGASAVSLLREWAFGPGVPEARAEAWTADILRYVPAPVLARDFRACDAFDAMAEVGRVAAPALAICGSADRLTPPKYSAFLAQRIPGCRLRILEGAGHFPMLEQPEAFNAALADFLASLAGGPAA